jgi:hypothetical protein
MTVFVNLSSWERLYTLYRIQGSSLSASVVHKRPDKWSVLDILCNGLESSLRFLTIILGESTTTHGALGKSARRNRHAATNLSGGNSFFLSFTSRDVPVVSLTFGKYYIVSKNLHVMLFTKALSVGVQSYHSLQCYPSDVRISDTTL